MTADAVITIYERIRKKLGNKKDVAIVIACGSGCVTSGVAKQKMIEIASEIGVPVNVSTCNISEINRYLKDADIACTTMPYDFGKDAVHCINVFPLVTGFNSGSCVKTLQTWMQEIYNG